MSISLTSRLKKKKKIDLPTLPIFSQKGKQISIFLGLIMERKLVDCVQESTLNCTLVPCMFGLSPPTDQRRRYRQSKVGGMLF